MTREQKMMMWAGIAIVLLAVLYLFVNAGRDDNGRTGTGERGEYAIVGFNISFDPPEGYGILEVPDDTNDRHSVVLSRGEDSDIPEGGEGPPAITINITEDVSDDAEQWVRSSQLSNFNLATSELSDTTVDGVPAKRYSWDGLYLGRSVVFKHEGNIVMVSGTYLTQDDPIFDDFDRVVSSIRLE